MVHDNRFIIWLFIVYGVNHVYSYLPYKDQAKLLSENGHLYIVSAEGANITLRTRGAGYININEENLLHVTYLARKAATAVEKFETESLVDIQTTINGLTATVRGPMLRRLERLETFIPNSTSGGFPTTVNVQFLKRGTRTLTRRFNMLLSQVRLIRRKLNTDDCVTNPCKNGGTCIDLYNDFHCLCPQLWEGQTCQIDVNECDRFKGTDLGCQNGATCQNTYGGYNCLCPENWFGLHCTRRTYDCTAQDSAEICGHGVCINKGGTGRGFTCICDQGWTSSLGTGTCSVDINECDQKAFPCSHDPPVRCVNLPGSFQCDPCPPGFSGNGYHCADIDECLVNNGGCSIQPQVQCINTRGSFSCGPCPPGYSGDGFKCDPVSSLCDVNNGGCNDMATCIHNPNLNYVQCRCPIGWTGSGIGPNGCVQLANISIAAPCLNNPCLNGGTCNAFPDGRFICRCLPIYSGPTCSEKISGCQPDPCKNGATCKEHGSNQIRCHCTPGFTGRLCENEEMGCVGKFTGLEGTIKWPRENSSISLQDFQEYSCNWGITSSNNSLVIKIEFTHFNIQGRNHDNCAFSYIEIFNGRTSSFPSFGRFCGTALPEPIISTHPSVFIVFKSFFRQNEDFSLKWTTVKPECGGNIDASVHGVLTSPGSPGPYPRNADCEWQLIAPEGKRIQLTFFSLDIEIHRNCSWDYLEILDGPLLISPLLKKFCNKTHPAPIISSSHTATIHFHSDNSGSGKGFQLTYSPIEGIPGCGGILTAPNGRITPPVSLTERNSYEENLNCEWKIQLPEGERIRLSFLKFNVENSINCKYDSIAVYDGPSIESDLFGKWCGTDAPVPIVSSTNILTIVFKSDYTYNEGEFLISYVSVCGGHFTDSSGIISSPYYPKHYPGNRVCTYIIEQLPGKAIVLKFLDIDIEESIGGECVFDYLKIYDGNSDTSPLLGEFCGNGTIGETISTHNFLYLVFRTDESLHGRGFYANYSTVDVGCGGILVASSGFISSPKYPEEYPENKDCKWIIKAQPGYLIQLTWISFKIEFSPKCVHDWIKIYDYTPNGTYQIGESYCGTNVPPMMTSSSNLLMIEFHTDISDAEPGFMATYLTFDSRTACGGNYFANVGSIKSPNFPNDYPDNLNCVWVITVPNGRQIKLNVIEFNIEKFLMHCDDDYLEIRNGGYESSPLIKRYCGTTIDTEITSMSNQIYIKFVSDSSFTTKGFLIKWDSSLRGCGGSLFGSSGDIISPNYPSPYGRNADCTWRISVAHGSSIKLMILDMDLEAEDNCYLDFLEIRDGVNKGANLLGRYCKEHLMAIQSTGNHLHLRFRSDISTQGRGFHLRYVTVCNRTITGFRGIIESPNFPNSEPDEINCNWIIEAPKGNSINISFSHFELVDHPAENFYEGNFRLPPPSLNDAINLVSKTNESCSQTYLQISEGSGTNLPSVKGATYCGTIIPPLYSSTLDHLYIHFKSSRLSQQNIFRFEWIVSGCGGHLKKPSDSLESPGYPNGYTRAYVCEWYITVEYGKRIELNINDLQLEKSPNCVYDSLKVYGGTDDKAPLLISRCDKTAEPIIVQTFGNNAFIRFESDVTYNGRGFHASYKSLDDAKCGGKFISTDGQIHSPNYPQNYDAYDDCSFLIQVEPTLRIILNFTDFDIFSMNDTDCDSSYVAVYDGDSIEAPELGKFCGNRLPKVIKSSSNQLFVRHKADGENVAKGFIAQYHQACGASITTDSSGVITFSEAQSVLFHYDADNCSWIVRSNKLESKITLHFLLMDVGIAANDSLYGVTIYAGEDTTSPRLGTYNGQWSPPPILVPSSAVTIVYMKSQENYFGRFTVEYSVLDTACGGNFISESGTIVSPNYPDNYPPNSECVWTLYTSPGNRVMLEIVELNTEMSESCNSDYLEVREKNNSGKLLGVFCGSEVPNRLYSNQSMWIKFHSSEASSDKGFKAHYNLVHGGELTGISGQFASPLYPDNYIKYGKFNWRITVRPSHVIRIAFVDLFIEKFDETSGCLDEVTIYDGYDTSARILKHVCGIQIPEPITSGSNVVYIEFSNFIGVDGSKFLIDWMQMPKQIGPINKNQNISILEGVLCSTKVELSLDPEKNNSYTFSSPGYPEGYKPNLNCEWIFETEPQNHFDILFTKLDLENSRICFADYVTLYKASPDNINNWDKIAQVCHVNQTLIKYSGNNIVKVVFHSDYFYNRTGFEAHASSVCGGSVNGPNGLIKNPPAYVRDTCQWTITVKPGQTIKIKFNKLKFPKDREGSSCGQQYILLRDGGTNDSPFLGAGKYCGEVLPDIPNTHSNKLFILFQSGYWMFQDHSQFELEYEAHSLNCGRNIVLSKNIQSTIIHSPNYPNVPSPHIQCIWTIMAPSGENIHFDILKRFDMTFSAECDKEYLELREGNTEIGHLIGRFCNTPPQYIITEGNTLYVKYFTDVNEPRDGFEANISLSKCGGNIFNVADGKILSPGFPESYDGNLTCNWRITTHDRYHLKLRFEKFNLGGTALKHYNDVCVENIEDTLTVTNLYNDDYSFSNDSKIFCGQSDSLVWESDSNIVQITFKSLKPSLSSKRMFSIAYESSLTAANCNEAISAPEGEIKSPGYPHSRKRVHCIWKITVPKGKRVTFTVTDFDLETNILSNLTKIGPQRVMFYNDKRFRARIATWQGYKEPGTFIESTSNFMLITYYLRNSNSHRGFSATYSSHNPVKCGGDLTDKNGTVYLTDLFRTEISLYCQWEYRSRLNFQATFTILIKANISTEKRLNEDCGMSKNTITVTDGSRSNLIDEFCKTTESNKPYIISTPHPVVVIYAMKSSSILGTNNKYIDFNFAYKVNQCGGILDSKTEYFVSPQYPQSYASNLDCVWLVIFDEESIIKVTFNSFDLETDCDNDYLAVHNGESARAPLIGKYCGNIPPPNLISNSNKLWFSFHSNDQLQSKGFNISLTPMQEGCGGILHGDGGEIQSLNYPSAYINNLECDWEIRVDSGFHIGLTFSGRFFIEQSVNCTNDYLEVSDYVNNEWKSLGRVCGRETTKVFNSTTNRMRLLFKTNDKIIGDGFKAIWNINCGGVIKTDRSGYLYSPGYPQNYKASLDCKYIIDLSTTKVITGQFEFFDLEEASSRGCNHDKVVIYTKNSGRMYRVFGTYCGDSRPPEFYSRGSFMIHFVTDDWDNLKGFVLRYSIPECGGDITQETEIVSPSYRTKGYLSPLDCVWNITAPKDKIITMRVTTRIPASRRCRHSAIQLWDGTEPIRGNNSNLIATLCGEMVKQPGQFRTKGNRAVFEFRSTNFQSPQTFSAIISFSYGEAAGCGGTIKLSTATSIQNPDKIDDYYYLDCYWYIEASEGYAITLTFQHINIENCNSNNISCSCDFIEVYDGPSMNNEIIGRFCGNISPGAISSSRRFISFRFVNDGNGNHSQFMILATPTPSPCGKTVLNVSSTPQELTSPNYPNNYPINIHCKWILVFPIWATFDVHIVDLDIEPSDTCSNDRLQINEIGRGFSYFLLWGANPNEKLIIGHDRVMNYQPSVYLGSRASYGKSTFCGQEQSMDYYSANNRLQISFVSDSQTTAKGFKIRYSIANCSRNYTAPQGRILQSRLTEDCTMYIKSTNPNDTISLYFNDISISYRQNCTYSGLKIYDVKNSTSYPVATLCGFKIPNPIFSTGPEVKLKYESKIHRLTSFDITYTATDQGRGCGGRFFNYGGVFTSPFYPSNQRKSTSCRWDITVPVGNIVVIVFQEFDLGPASTCATDFITIYDYDVPTDTEKFRVRYCGGEKPAKFEGTTNSAYVVYKTSVHNGGTGWLARFMSKGPGYGRLLTQDGYGQ